MPETAEVAYTVFCQAKGYKNWAWWRDLPETEKDVWREVTREVFRQGWWESAPPPRGSEDRLAPVFFLVRVLLLPSGGISHDLPYPPHVLLAPLNGPEPSLHFFPPVMR
jgi:hypothetical protein